MSSTIFLSSSISSKNSSINIIPIDLYIKENNVSDPVWYNPGATYPNTNANGKI